MKRKPYYMFILLLCLMGCTSNENIDETTTLATTTTTTEVSTITDAEEEDNIYVYDLRQYDVRADKNSEECNDFVTDFFTGTIIETKTIKDNDYFLDDKSTIYKYAEGWEGSNMDLLAPIAENTGISNFAYMKIENNILIVVDSNNNYYIGKTQDINNLDIKFEEISKGTFNFNVKVADIKISNEEIIVTLIKDNSYITLSNKKIDNETTEETKKENKEENKEETSEEIILEEIDTNNYWYQIENSSNITSIANQINTWYLDTNNKLHILNDENPYNQLSDITFTQLYGENDRYNIDELNCYAIDENNNIYVLSNNIEEISTETDSSNNETIKTIIKDLEGNIEIITSYNEYIIIKTSEKYYLIDKDYKVSECTIYEEFNDIKQIYQNKIITNEKIYKILNF